MTAVAALADVEPWGVVRTVAAVLLAAAAVLSIVIVVHESGHFVVAKLFGIRVDEFSLGFGPRLLSRVRGETRYSIRAIPAGGFVRMAGMLGLEGEPDAGERNFYRATIPRRLTVMGAGIAFNAVFAIPCLAVAAGSAVPSHLSRGEPAYAAGLRDGDSIVDIDGRPIDNSSEDSVSHDLHAATAGARGRTMSVVYRDADGGSRRTSVAPELVLYNDVPPRAPDDAPVGAIVVTAVDGRPVAPGDPATLLGGGGPVRVSGVMEGSDPPARVEAVRVSGVGTGDPAPGARRAAWRLGFRAGHDAASVPAALVAGLRQARDAIGDSISGLAHLIASPSSVTGAGGQVSGPIGIALESEASARSGLASFVGFVGLLSLAVGFLNVLPIPFLDGGRIAFVLLEALRRRRLDPRREAMIYAASLAVLVVVAVFITIGDINRIPDWVRSP